MPNPFALQKRPDARFPIAWLPIPVLLLAIIITRAFGGRGVYEADGLRLVVSFVFYTLVSLGTMYLIGRSFLASGRPGLLFLECGVILWSLAGTVGDAVYRGDQNINVSIFNTCILLAGLFHLAGAVFSIRPQRPFGARRVRPALACVAMAVGFAAVAVTMGQAGGPKTPPQPHGPTLAVEDTLHATAAEPLPEILVTAPRQSLDEILRHVAEGEAQRDSLINDQAYTLYMRMVGRDSKKERVEQSDPYFESAMRVYQKRPDRQRVIMLKQWSRYDEKKEAGHAGVEIRQGNGSRSSGNDESRKSGVNVTMDSDMSEQFVSYAFHPDTRSRYHFRIEDRKVIGDQVIYVIGFMPKSPLDPLPTGRAWVDTNDFVILREEFAYKDRSPAPLFIESLDSCILERTRIDGRYWVLSRVLARVTLTDPVRWMGKVARTKLPKVADFAIRWDDWIVNGDIPDSLFTPAGEVRK